jgi:uroporphyrinogen-III synthase
MRVLVTRPEPDASRQAEMLSARGHEPVVAPLLTIEYLDDAALDLAGAQALIVTSRNALRALARHKQRDEALKVPVLAVGDATAHAAQELGFREVTIGLGTGAALAGLITQELAPGEGPLIHMVGDALAFDLAAALEAHGFTVRKTLLYRGVPADTIPAETLSMLLQGGIDGVILMSPRTARVFMELLAKHDAVEAGKGLICYCLSEAIAEELTPLGFAVRVAATPREEDVLALLDSEAASSA